MFYTVYKITNLTNGKIYIGKHKTSRLDDGYLGSGKHIRSAVKKYGKECFHKEILFVFDTPEAMNEKEAELVTDGFVVSEDNYNLTKGGQGDWSYINENNIPKFKGKHHKDESKASMGHPGNSFALGKTHNEETKRKIGEASKKRNTGKTLTIDTKKKISATLRNKSGFDLDYMIECISYAKKHGLSERKACNFFGINRITYRKYHKEYAGVA